MALKRNTSYSIEQTGAYSIEVKTVVDSKSLTISQRGGEDETHSNVHVTFDQLVELIAALNEIRVSHIPTPYRGRD